MTYEIDLMLRYAAGDIEVRFEADEFPENWSDIRSDARSRVKDELFDLASINEWVSHFDTAQEFGMPGQTLEPDIGTLVITNDDELEVQLEIDSPHNCF